MKKALKILMVVVIVATFSTVCYATEEDKYLEDFENAVPEEYKGSVGSAEEIISSLGIGALLSEIGSAVSGEGSRVGGFFLLLIGLLSLTALSSLVPDEHRKITEAGVLTLASLAIYAGVSPLFGEVTSSLSKLSSFFAAVAPILSSVSLSGGGVGSAAVQSSAMSITLSLVGGAGSALLSAVSGFALAMSLVSAFGGDGAASLSQSVRSIFGWVLGILTALFTGTLSLQTLISSASDSAAMRAAKYLASGMIPVVGGTVAGSLSTLASGLSYVKSFIGAGGIFVIFSMALSPVVLLLLYRLALSASASAATLVGASGFSSVISAYRFALDTLIALYCLSSLLYIFEIILFVKSGVAIS